MKSEKRRARVTPSNLVLAVLLAGGLVGDVVGLVLLDGAAAQLVVDGSTVALLLGLRLLTTREPVKTWLAGWSGQWAFCLGVLLLVSAVFLHLGGPGYFGWRNVSWNW
ncbi:hypothetical protein ABZT17_09490 [Streptomyces sp. NPDC005648]|uniref:hypothetical protein n=1 Tax=Streptomyces sp. NPDC005648 TaxID=3157044 RepID=UPI00339FBD74